MVKPQDWPETVHTEQLAEHGGGTGIRNEELLESALARSQQIYAYDDTADICTLAAAYGYGIAKNHPFVDGNKRTAYVTMLTFLLVNGYRLTAEMSTVMTPCWRWHPAIWKSSLSPLGCGKIPRQQRIINPAYRFDVPFILGVYPKHLHIAWFLARRPGGWWRLCAPSRQFAHISIACQR